MKQFVKVSLLALCMVAMASMACATGMQIERGKSAIVIASFGTTVPSGVKSITNILSHVKKAYPKTEVRLTFTSNIIRSVWKKRQAEPQKWLDQGIPKEVLYVQNIIATVGDLVEDGYTNIVVQPTHIFFMEESTDLLQYVDALGSIRTLKDKWMPINNIVMGRPALGEPGDLHPYHEDVAEAVKTLAPDVALAKKEGRTLVYMGHGNEHWSTGIYNSLQREMKKQYPDVKTIVGVVEGAPTVEDVARQLKHNKADKVMLKAFMIVAGDHATNDMAGDDDDSWKSILTQDGFNVKPVLHGLGENDAFAEIFVKHIADRAREAGITLK
ncbi:sirohydrochlorin cobaltochelatase [Desulforhopalus vacuolatus]|uniref:sirohydrochlorin cobaltochelatase n=1 Tax=Desulforhopalus vacuolatus TaxID=40414 RepID=UPI00196566A1|nr:sirohydrochlorin cobaltochelatase [Desulforhopalus vacuolatus]MBM9518783.1 sirohydrochlorin cobaltochelatase [Desulforhopalus vacuolatus]